MKRRAGIPNAKKLKKRRHTEGFTIKDSKSSKKKANGK